MRFELRNPDAGELVEVEAIQSDDWFAAVRAEVGARIWIDYRELGATGWADVVSIQPCPELESGPGRVILATLTRLNDSLIAIQFEEDEKPLEVTAGHLLFSEDRNDWTKAGYMQTGENLLTSNGSLKIASISSRPDVYRVYNFEVEADHRYFVGKEHILAHNASLGLGKEIFEGVVENRTKRTLTNLADRSAAEALETATRQAAKSLDEVGEIGLRSIDNVAPKSGHTPFQKIGIAETDLSQAVIDARKIRGDRSGNNWLSFKLRGDDRIHVIRSKGGVHSERRLQTYLKKTGRSNDDLIEFFSERGPCTYAGQGGCQRFMQTNFPNAKGTYLFDYFDQSTRNASRSPFGKYVRRIFNPDLD